MKKSKRLFVFAFGFFGAEVQIIIYVVVRAYGAGPIQDNSPQPDAYAAQVYCPKSIAAIVLVCYEYAVVRVSVQLEIHPRGSADYDLIRVCEGSFFPCREMLPVSGIIKGIAVSCRGYAENRSAYLEGFLFVY